MYVQFSELEVQIKEFLGLNKIFKHTTFMRFC